MSPLHDPLAARVRRSSCWRFRRQAKTLVFCSEGNPEALNPQIVTTTTGMNAGRPMFNNLVEFKRGTTARARPRRELDSVRRRPDLHFPPAPRREVPLQRPVPADPRR